MPFFERHTLQMESLRCLFIIQGEGRGHMTQALALQTMLERAGHSVCGVLVGRSAHRAIPAFFLDAIAAPVTSFDSPNFLKMYRRKGAPHFVGEDDNASLNNWYTRITRIQGEQSE